MHTTYTERSSYMFITKYVQTKDSDVRYNDVVLLGLTHDKNITDKDNIIYNGAEYKVTHTINAIGPIHWDQVFMEVYNNG